MVSSLKNGWRKTTIMAPWEEGAKRMGGSPPRHSRASLMKRPGSAHWLNKGVGKPTAGGHVHVGHVDLNVATSSGRVEGGWGRSTSWDEWSGRPPGSIAGVCRGRSKGGVVEMDGRRAPPPSWRGGRAVAGSRWRGDGAPTPWAKVDSW